MIQNLFSILSNEQINSLTSEERLTLTQIDKKLFPDYDLYVDRMQERTSIVDKLLDRRKKEAENDADYQKMIESSFC